MTPPNRPAGSARDRPAGASPTGDPGCPDPRTFYDRGVDLPEFSRFFDFFSNVYKEYVVCMSAKQSDRKPRMKYFLGVGNFSGHDPEPLTRKSVATPLPTGWIRPGGHGAMPPKGSERTVCSPSLKKVFKKILFFYFGGFSN